MNHPAPLYSISLSHRGHVELNTGVADNIANDYVLLRNASAGLMLLAHLSETAIVNAISYTCAFPSYE